MPLRHLLVGGCSVPLLHHSDMLTRDQVRGSPGRSTGTMMTYGERGSEGMIIEA